MTDRHPLDQLPTLASFTMATTAASTGLIVSAATNTQNYKAVSWHGSWGLTSLTEGDGPLLFGLADGELTLVEIEEYLESIPITKMAAPKTEHVRRAVQVWGSIGKDNLTQYLTPRVVLPTFRETRGYIFWVYNTGIAMTTGALLKIRGRFFGRWLD